MLTFSSCASLTNHIKEFGEARITADYFFKDYSDFFYYFDKDYVCVTQCSSKVIKGDYVSAINGKKGNSYRFYTFANYDEKEYLKDGDFVLMDCGAYFDGGFATDITRTFHKGELSDEQKMIFETGISHGITFALTRLVDTNIDLKVLGQ